MYSSFAIIFSFSSNYFKYLSLNPIYSWSILNSGSNSSYSGSGFKSIKSSSLAIHSFPSGVLTLNSFVCSSLSGHSRINSLGGGAFSYVKHSISYLSSFFTNL